MDNSSFILGEILILLSLILGCREGKKISRKVYLNSTVTNLIKYQLNKNIASNHRICMISNPQRTFKIDYILGNERDLNKFKELKSNRLYLLTQ